MDVESRCASALVPIVVEGANEMESFIVCASLLEQSCWHLPKVGRVKLNLRVEGGAVVEGALVFGKISFPVVSILAGLTGECVAIMTKCGDRSVKLYLDIPLQPGANPALSALWEMRREMGSKLEEVALWLTRLQ